MATSYVLQNMGKFSDGTGLDLNEFLDRFDRCCLVANKVDAQDAPVKGQLLMLWKEGLEQPWMSLNYLKTMFHRIMLP